MEDILRQLGETGELMTLAGDKRDRANVEAEANATPIIRYVDLVLYQAIQDRASDIHFEPFEDGVQDPLPGGRRALRNGAAAAPSRAARHLAREGDGEPEHRRAPPAAGRPHPEEHRGPRGGSARFHAADAVRRERRAARARPLDREPRPREPSACRITSTTTSSRTIEKPNGIFIVTGPTGSGKTTTLYACLRKINTIDSKLLTAEDPVEYDIDGIMQVPVNEAHRPDLRPRPARLPAAGSGPHHGR